MPKLSATQLKKLSAFSENLKFSWDLLTARTAIADLHEYIGLKRLARGQKPSLTYNLCVFFASFFASFLSLHSTIFCKIYISNIGQIFASFFVSFLSLHSTVFCRIYMSSLQKATLLVSFIFELDSSSKGNV